ncbi:DUF4224 domain-containing protein [Chromobacterium vaccinii]|uniref:DUF4224 domain-containing protein n=1 Tax=Chromobacterium vaccinii TaxID=1108595 RepID=UPI000E208308|nr:DUF4224 domain-containing protein [Chromobacterium vaccinii]
MFLSDEEIQALTGRKRVTLQREWLTLRGWLHEVNAAGRPVVLRAYAESRLSGHKAGAIASASPQPNFAALKS